MGDQHEVEFCVSRMEKVQDDGVRVKHLLRDLACTHQPAAIEVIKRHLLTDQRLPEPQGNGAGILFAQYAAHLLAQLVADFPLADLSGDYTEAQIRTAREWLKTHPELAVKN